VNRYRLNALVVACSIALTPGLRAQSHQSANTLKLDRPGSGAKAKIADIAWLEGHWTGTGLGGEVEEAWGPPLGNSMIGMFRLLKGGKTVVCELCTIQEVNGSLLLKVKHFDANLVGREEKDASMDFPLVSLSQAEANFDGLTFRKAKDGDLSVFVLFHQRNGQEKEELFQYRQRLTPAGRTGSSN
jgi:hypothetical protein